MKLKSAVAPKSSSVSKQSKTKIESERAPQSKGAGGAWKAEGKMSATVAKKSLTAQATKAVSEALHAQSSDHPALEKFGEALGMGLGLIVTEALALNPSWNKPVLDASGKPAKSIPGAERIGNHDILKRHQEVAGPKIAALVAKMSPGVIHDLLDGLAKGATAAPGTSYRIESAAADMLHRR
jgi:hypothetical protein